MIDFQKLAEDLNECVNDKLIIRVGRYEGDFHVGDGEFERITGELYIKTNSDTLFRAVSDDSRIVDDFDIIGNDAIVVPIDKEFENSQISYDEVDINDKSSLRAYFPKDEEGIEMFECVQSVPPRFRQDALDVFDFAEDREMWDMRTIDKAWDYFLEDILLEMTKEEIKEYGFEEMIEE